MVETGESSATDKFLRNGLQDEILFLTQRLQTSGPLGATEV